MAPASYTLHWSYFGLAVLAWIGPSVISGFLITTLLLRERQFTGRISLSHFYRRRALRIFLLHAWRGLAIYTLGVVILKPTHVASRHFFDNYDIS